MANLKRDGDGLTEMQRRFVEAYMGPALFNATGAAKLAGYSERTAYSIGHELLSKAHVRRAIERRVDELYEAFESDRWPVGAWYRELDEGATPRVLSLRRSVRRLGR